MGVRAGSAPGADPAILGSSGDGERPGFMKRRVTGIVRGRGGLLAGVAAVLLAAALAGALAPAAAAAPDAAQIDAFLVEHGSPMAGTGDTFVAAAESHGIDPSFLVAIAGAESSFGQLLYSQDGDQCTYNAFNWFYGPTWPTSDFTSWDEAIDRVAAGLGGDLYYGSSLYSVDEIAPKYCPDGTANWIANVKTFMVALGGNPDDTRLGAAAPTAEPSSPPPSTEPGLIALEGSVKLDRGDREVGQSIYAWFTLTNTGGRPLDLEGIRLAVRGPGSSVHDLVSDEPLTLAAGQSTEVSASWPLDLAGRWNGWIEVSRGGTASLVGEEQAFAFWVKLPKAHELRRWELRDSALSEAL
jgi:hypothetical protein